jgi:5'-nucleotidase
MTLWLDEKGNVESTDGRLLSLTDVDPSDAATHAKVVEWEKKGEAEMGKVIGCSDVDLVGVDHESRQHETNLGNLFTDATRKMHHTDVALINGGTIRGNKVYEKGELTKASMTAMHPFGNAIVKFYATGKELKAYIESTLNCWESFCGAFVQISGLNYTFNSDAKAGSRLKSLVHPDGKPVGDKETFTVAMSDYMMANSPLNHNKLFEMTIINDAVPIVIGLFEAAKEVGNGNCLSPKVEGRIVNTAL